MIANGRKLAPAILFFGCRSPDQDDLYRGELDTWQEQGVVDVRRAYSRAPESSEGCKYVQDRLLKDKDDFLDLWENGATVFVCGSSAMADSVKESWIKIKIEMERRKGEEMDVETAQEWFDSQRNIRYVMDVFD